MAAGRGGGRVIYYSWGREGGYTVDMRIDRAE
jgi:hypothetical protein